MSKYLVKGYCYSGDYHWCENLETHEEHRIDLMVSADLREFEGRLNDLVGRTVEVTRLFPFVELTDGVRLLPETMERIDE